MGIKLPGVLQAKQILRRSLLTASPETSNAIDVPKGYLAVYVGESQKRRYLVPVSYLNQLAFQELLHKAEEEYGFDHPRVVLQFLAQRMPSSILLLFEWFLSK